MTMRIVGGFTKYDGALGALCRDSDDWGAAERQRVNEWGISSEGMIPWSDSAQVVQFAEGYAWDHAIGGRIYARSYFVVDPLNPNAHALVGSETFTFDTDLTSEGSTVRLGSRGTRRVKAFEAYAWSEDFGLSYQQTFLWLQLASKEDPKLFLEKLVTNGSSTKPCARMFKFGEDCRGEVIAQVGAYGKHGKFGDWTEDNRRDCYMYAVIAKSEEGDRPKNAVLEGVTTRNGMVPLVAAAAATTLAVAAPAIVTGIVSAIGFETSGIAAGSTAAAMMSAEAVASGGGVAAGGLVATLQSIGAAGLGTAGVSAAASAGAAVGASAGTAISATALALRPGHRLKGERSGGKWFVVTSERAPAKKVYEFMSASAAKTFFDSRRWCTRILVNPTGQEEASGVVVVDAVGVLQKVREAWLSQDPDKLCWMADA